jgi:hypothetical protein
MIGGTMVLIGAGTGAVVAYLQLSQQQQASRDLLISNQVSKGFEQLGSDKVVVRLGGIYALEGVMNTSEQYHRPVLEALSAFVRDDTRTQKGNGPPATDVQAALTVIGTRKAIGTGNPDLAHANIPKADMSGADLTGADLGSANLSGSNLSGADLTVADLNGANLSDANLSSTFEKHITSRITYSRESRGGRAANLTNAFLLNADLRGANLSGANLSAAYLTGAHLSGADLSHANLTGAHLNGADLSHAKLTGADLTGAIVSQMQLDTACGTTVKLDSGLTLKPC